MDELIVNGGAEEDLDGWTVSEPTAGRTGTTTSPVQTGSKAFDFDTRIGSDTEGDKTIHQFFPTVPGKVYEGVISINGEDADPAGQADNHLIIVTADLDGDQLFETTLISKGYAFAPSWASFTFTFTAGAAQTGLKIVNRLTGALGLGTVNFYVDNISVPALVEEPFLGLNPVTIGELLDIVQFNAGDFTSAYRIQARHWLNLVRSYAAGEGWWRSALNGEATINVSGANTNGIYPLKDAAAPIPQVYAFVEGDQLVDVTDNRILFYRHPRELERRDANLDEQNAPNFWTDKGYNSDGEPQIMLFPRPTVATTIRASMYRQYAAIDENADTLTVDPFFGPVDDWAFTFQEGLRYYLEQDENEMGTQSQWLRFVDWVKRRKKKQGIPLVTSGRFRSMKPGKGLHAHAVFDQSHFDNPGL